MHGPATILLHTINCVVVAESFAFFMEYGKVVNARKRKRSKFSISRRYGAPSNESGSCVGG